MINLTTSSINPSFIETVSLKTATHTTSNGGYQVQVNSEYYWSPTKTAVVVYYASGRVEVYGGSDANTIWMHYFSVPAYIDTTPRRVLEGHGLVVNIRDGEDDGKAWSHSTYDWGSSSVNGMDDDDAARALCRLLLDNEYLYGVTADLDNHKTLVEFRGGGLSIKGPNDQCWDLMIAYTPFNSAK